MLQNPIENGVSIIIPTLNGGEVFRQSLAMIAQQDYPGEKEIIVLDSGSSDGTVEAARLAGAKVHQIAPEEFHHSRTRNEGVKLAQYPVVVMLVQDAVPAADSWLTDLVNALNKEPGIVAAYGRPLPQKDADVYARFEVEEYRDHLGSTPFVQKASLSELKRLNTKQLLRLARIHNVCAAYKKEFLQAHTFPEVMYAEDLAWGLSAVSMGYGINYEPKIEVYHSHNRPPIYRFKRALVETIVCSNILGNSKYRIPFFTATEIRVVFENLDLSIDEIKSHKSQLKEETSEASFGFNGFSGIKGSVLSRIKTYLFTFILRKKIIGIYNEILLRYPAISSEDKRMVVDQISASLKGRALGVIYLKHKSKGHISKEISDMVLPNLTGV